VEALHHAVHKAFISQVLTNFIFPGLDLGFGRFDNFFYNNICSFYVALLMLVDMKALPSGDQIQL
jgi:hypothetical protein